MNSFSKDRWLFVSYRLKFTISFLRIVEGLIGISPDRTIFKYSLKLCNSSCVLLAAFIVPGIVKNIWTILPPASLIFVAELIRVYGFGIFVIFDLDFRSFFVYWFTYWLGCYMRQIKESSIFKWLTFCILSRVKLYRYLCWFVYQSTFLVRYKVK